MKFRIKNMTRHEEGQAMVEFALVFPIFIFLLCFIIDCGWIWYQRILFDYAYRDASWELKVPLKDSMFLQPYYIKDYDAEVYIKNSILNVGVGSLIDPDNLHVSNSRITLMPRDCMDVNPGATRGTYENSKYNTINMFMKADLQYVIHVITPVGQRIIGKTVTANGYLEKDRVLSFRQDNRY